MEFQPKDNEELELIGKLGHEFGATTGRKRQCNYLNLDTLKEALLINQCNRCIINKIDILQELGIFKLYHNNELKTFNSFNEMSDYIFKILDFVGPIIFSNNKYTI
jgi:adenylosuccinate synthase